MYKIKDVGAIKRDLLNMGLKEVQGVVGPRDSMHLCYYEGGKKKGNSLPIFTIDESSGIMWLVMSSYFISRRIPDVLIELLTTLKETNNLEYAPDVEPY